MCRGPLPVGAATAAHDRWEARRCRAARRRQLPLTTQPKAKAGEAQRLLGMPPAGGASAEAA